MPKEYTTLPSVADALASTRNFAFRGNTNGQHGVYNGLTKEDIELAAQFDTNKELQLALDERKRVGLS